MDLSTEVVIFNWNTVKNSAPFMVLGVDQTGKLILREPDFAIQDQLVWVLVPNFTAGASYAGYSIVNNALQEAAVQPAEGQQIALGDDPTPYGDKAYCWTLFPTGTAPNGAQLWSIQDYQRGPVMDAAHSGTSEGTPILFWDWNGGDNQQWILNPASTSLSHAGGTMS